MPNLKYFFLTGFFCFLGLRPVAQEKYRHPSTLGVHLSFNDFEHRQPSAKFSAMDAGLGISYLRGISPHFDYMAQLRGSFPDSISRRTGRKDRSLLLQGGLGLRARPLGRPSAVQPFLSAGIGFFTYRSGAGIYSFLGGGLQLNYKDLYLTTSIQYRPSLAGNISSHYCYSLGISGLIGKPGNKTKKQPLPERPVLRPVRDRDGDGILDSADRCPALAGLARFQGCPDSDRDGIEDGMDKCPSVAGIERYGGCPVPDTDKDGVNDESDSCVTVPGPPENRGCPVSRGEITEDIRLAAKNILFQSGSALLLPSSYPHLNRIAGLLKDHPRMRLAIEGHTDSDGDALQNQLLSENRARAVKDYLVSKGIEKHRLEASGFGEQRPVAPNTTRKGKAANRRVEMRVLNGYGK